jgi:hypothetical protein
MKIYTEEQVKHAIQMARASQNLSTTPFIYDKYEILEQLTPIELPSDDEIWDRADEIWGRAESEQSDVRHLAFMQSAKWMRDKIQGGNK